MARKSATAPAPEPEFSPEELEQLGQAGPQNEPTDEQLAADEADFDMENYRPDDDDDGEEQPQKKQTEDQEQTEGQKKVQKVDYGALAKERAVRKEIQAERDQWRERNTLLEKRLNLILERMNAPQQEQKPQVEEDPMPDAETQPFEYIKWQQRQLEDLRAKVNGREQQEQRQTQEQEILSQGTALAMQVRDENPEEYDAAYEFVTRLRVGQLQALGMDGPAIQRTVANELKNGMITALQRNINPGRFLLAFAKNSGFVYQKQQQPQDEQNPIRKLQENVQKNKTLGQSPKHGSTGSLTAEDIAAMSDDEFEAYYSKVGKKGFAKKFAM